MRGKYSNERLFQIIKLEGLTLATVRSQCPHSCTCSYLRVDQSLGGAIDLGCCTGSFVTNWFDGAVAVGYWRNLVWPTAEFHSEVLLNEDAK